jgi:hypothetical protein
MNHGGFFDDGKDNQSSTKTYNRGGLVPINAHILKKATINQDEVIEYNGVQLSDVTIVGYIQDFTEGDNKIKVTLWDHTGDVDIIFFNRIDNEDNSSLNNFIFTE